MKKMKWISTLAAGVVVALGLASLTPNVFAGEDHKDHKSTEKPAAKGATVGQAAPDFTLTDTNGKTHTLSSLQGKVVVLEWFNSACPFVVRHHEKYKTMTDLAKKYDGKVVWLAINSSAPGKEGFGKDKDAIAKWKLAYPVLLDSDGKTGKTYGAKTTPHMFVIDTKGVLAYAGAIDNDPKDELSPDKKVNYVGQAIEELLAGKTVSTKETKSYGCSVKYAD